MSGERYDSVYLQLSVNMVGGSVMVWACVLVSAVGNLIKNAGRKNVKA